MHTKTCFYCDKNDELNSLMIHICELSSSDLYLNLNQSHLGRVILASKIHIKEIFELSNNERNAFMADVSLVSEVLQTIFCPDKINYAIYGDLVNHFHMHIVPKYEDKKNWGVPYNDESPVFLSDQEYEILRDKISEKMNI
jgi:diadenosine tetraphosphate (Ap4A) HIT family hydrolase